MRTASWFCVVLCGLAACGAGCNKNKAKNVPAADAQAKAEPTKEIAPPPPPPVEPKKTPKSLLGNIYRTMEDTEFDNALRNIALALQTYEVTNGKFPAKMEDLAPNFEGHPKIKEAFQWLEFRWGAPNVADKANTLLGWEIGPDRANHRRVITAGGMFKKIPEEEFATAPKAPAK